MHYLWLLADNTWKRLLLGVVILVALAQAFVSALPVRADTGTWVSGDLPVLSVAQQIPSPTNSVNCFPSVATYWSYTKLNGSFDSIGRPIDVNVCATENPLGLYGGSGSSDNYSYVRPNTTYAFPVFNAAGNSSSVTPVPNQATFITKDSSQSFNGEVAPHFFDSFPEAGVFGPLNNQLSFKVNQAGATLTDSTGAKLYMHAYAFSNNGEWMVIEARGLGLVRVNTATRQMQLFDPLVLTYGQGFPIAMTFAISDDGNTVIKSGKNASDTYAYDLSGCQPGTFAIGANNASAMQGCQKRALQTSLKAQLSNFQFVTGMRFNADGKSLSVTAVASGLNNVQLYYAATYSTAGYQQSHLDYLALGDSFSSGEGAYAYEPGTNETQNTCHLSRASYPYLVASNTGATDDFRSVACSGALTENYFSLKQHDNTPDFVWTPGEEKQSTFVSQASPRVVTISMIGNDIGFGDLLMRCMSGADSCLHFKEDRQNVASEIHDKFNRLISLYSQIKIDSGNKDSVRIYVLGYPQIFGDGLSCDINVPFSQEERLMARGLTTYLNAIIKSATQSAGVQYIDVEDAFNGHENCEPGTKAVNALSIDAAAPLDDLTLLHGSFHPNAFGQQLLAEALLRQSSNLQEPMPLAIPTITAPYIGSAEYDGFIGNAPSGGTLEHVLYIGSTELGAAYRAADLSIDIPHTLVQLAPNSQVEAWFNSTPVHAGTLTTGPNGELSGRVTIPNNLEPGFHALHLYGTDVGGQQVDLYQAVYVAASPDDYNGDGVPNTQDLCKIVPASGMDQDKDGIDDACDPEIDDVPADTTAPEVTGSADREPDHNGWYNHSVTITWTAADPEPSSGAPSQPEPTIADQEGDQAYTSQQSCDGAGNCATGTTRLKLDKTIPDITYTISPSPSSNGWNNGAVIVRFACSDKTSGVESCTEPVIVSGDGEYVVAGTVVDGAGNANSINVFVNLDSSAPGILQQRSASPNANGWHNAAVTITTLCNDDLSGIAYCSDLQTVSDEGQDQIVTSQAIDNAGNSLSLSSTVNLDFSAPIIQSLEWSANPKPNIGSSWLTIHGSDNLSGIASAEYYIGDLDPGLGNGTAIPISNGNITTSFGTDYPAGVYEVNVRVKDAADNWSATATDYLVVYNPFNLRIMGTHSVLPSLPNGDSLPGLIDASQAELAKFAFNVGYDRDGHSFSDNDMRFSYKTGRQCENPVKAQNCHTLELNASTVDWVLTQGTNGATAVFQGKAALIIDSVSLQALYRVTAIDGERLSAASTDHFTLQIFADGANPNTAAPLCQISDNVLRGNIHIR